MKSRHLTIGALAKASGLSRSTLLYYDRLGLLRPERRTVANYRLYSHAEARRLEQVCLYRGMGIPLKEIKVLLEGTGTGTAVRILRNRLQAMEIEISELRRRQQSIVRILKQKPIQREEIVITKKRWVEIMQAAGFSEQDMRNWHAQFEKLEPEAHQEFLESLGIETAEIEKIRKFSRS